MYVWGGFSGRNILGDVFLCVSVYASVCVLSWGRVRGGGGDEVEISCVRSLTCPSELVSFVVFLFFSFFFVCYFLFSFFAFCCVIYPLYPFIYLFTLLLLPTTLLLTTIQSLISYTATTLLLHIHTLG